MILLEELSYTSNNINNYNDDEVTSKMMQGNVNGQEMSNIARANINKYQALLQDAQERLITRLDNIVEKAKQILVKMDTKSIDRGKYRTNDEQKRYNRVKDILDKYEPKLRAAQNERNAALAGRFGALKLGGKYKTRRRTRKQKKSTGTYR
jgi:predicted metal-dependent phosphoesterase TrpH